MCVCACMSENKRTYTHIPNLKFLNNVQERQKQDILVGLLLECFCNENETSLMSFSLKNTLEGVKSKKVYLCFMHLSSCAFLNTFYALPVYLYYPCLLISSFCLYVFLHVQIGQVLMAFKKTLFKVACLSQKIKQSLIFKKRAKIGFKFN